MTCWQREQFDSVKDSLPLNHVLCVYDFSENYRCSYQDEVQLQYFSKGEVSIHVTILYRHSTLDFDGAENTHQSPVIVKEYIFTIPDDLLHDSCAVQHVRTLILNDKVKCPIDLMHEFTVGCSAQYKTHHCMGSHVLMSQKDFGHHTVRNYFETSHAKGEQDAAGAHIKQRTAIAVVRNEVTIQNDHDLCEFLACKFSSPVGENVELKHRRFFYVDQGKIVRKGRKFTDVKENRKIHCIKADKENTCLLADSRSCYCQTCLYGEHENCLNQKYLDEWRRVDIELESQPSEKVTRSEPVPEVARTEMIADMAVKDSVVAVAAEGDPNYDYYLLKVTSHQIEEVNTVETDDYGTTLATGCKILWENLFVPEILLDMTYKLDLKKWPLFMLGLSDRFALT